MPALPSKATINTGGVLNKTLYTVTMFLYGVSFLGGMLTILAPCVLPVLPVILGGSFANSAKGIQRPLVITASLAVSITIFTIALRATTALISIPPQFWKSISGAIIILYGISIVFPNAWSVVAHKIKLEQTSQQALQHSSTNTSVWGLIALGASLGPVFVSCSPTYSIILAVVLPISFTQAIINIAIYSIGLAVMLLLIAVFGRTLIQKLGIVAKPNSVFKKILGVVLIIVGLGVITGIDKYLEAKILDAGYTGVLGIEEQLIENVRNSLQN